jgi:DNA primase small subunit
MNEKNWLGAELIFDLDADHLPDAPRNYADMLELVKKETFKLMDFLLTIWVLRAGDRARIFRREGVPFPHYKSESPEARQFRKKGNRELCQRQRP